MLYRLYGNLYIWRLCIFKNTADTKNEYHNHFILNQIPDFYIMSLFKVMDDIFELLTKLLVDKIIKRINHMSKLWIIYQKSMYGTKIIKIQN